MSARTAYLFLICFLFAPGMAAHGAGLDDADERLFKVQMAMAEKGNTRAQYYLGEMHEQGLGTKPDLEEAFKWYAKAAEKGDPLAQRKLAMRQEILNEAKKEQEMEERLKVIKPAPVPDKPVAAKAKPTPAAPEPVSVASNEQARRDEEARIKREAERQKRRAAVRAMILERLRNPVGELFDN